MRTKLTPIVETIAANMIERGFDLSDPNLAEDILEDVRHETGGQLDYKPMDICISMVLRRLRAKAARLTSSKLST